MSALLPQIAVGFALGIALADRVSASAPIWPVQATACGLLVAAVVSIGHPRWARAALVGAAFAIGVASLGVRLEQARAERPAGSFDAVTTGQVCGARRSAAMLELELCGVLRADAAAPVPPRTLILRSELPPASQQAGLETLRSGEWIRASLRIAPARGLRNPGRPTAERRLARRGFGAVATLRDPALWVRVEAPRSSVAAVPYWPGSGAWRARASGRLRDLGPGGGLLGALALGDRSGVETLARDAFARLGIAHLLAISGLHVALVAAGLYGLVRRALASTESLARRIDVRRPAVVLAVAGAGGYVLLSGCGVPARRALIALVVLGGAVLAGRPARSAQALALAGLGILASEPAALFDPGPQLSFAATGALLWAAGRGAHPLQRPRWLEAVRGILETTCIAMAATLPILAMHGMPSGVVGLFVNLVAVPWTALVLLPGALLAATIAGLPAHPLADGILLRIAALGQGSLDVVGRASEALPPSLPVAAPHPLAIGLAAGLAIAVALARSVPGRIGLLVLALLVVRCAPPAALRPGPPRVVALDVGLGDATLVQGRTASLLVDAGRALPGRFDLGRSTVVPALAALGVERLDWLVVSHADLDHRGGVPAVLANLPVGEVWVPPGGLEDAALADVRSAANARGVPVRERGAGSALVRRGDLTLEVLSPSTTTAGSRNDRSLVIRASLAGRRVLLTGDVGSEVERQLVAEAADRLPSDVLKVAHHGSAGSTSAALLSAVAPRLALLSAPCGGRGRPLPSPVALERIGRAGVPLAWTGRHGAILVGLVGPELEVRHWGEARPGCED